MTRAANNYGQAIQKRRQELGETQESLADAIGLSQPFIGKLERGAADVNAMKLRNFANLLDRLRWSAAEFAEHTGIDIDPLLRPGGGAGKKGKVRPADPLVRAEVYAPAQAGMPTVDDAVHHTHTYLNAADFKQGVELYIAQGDSMTTSDPNSIHDGDILHVNSHDRALVPGRIYLIKIIGDGLTVKRLREFGGEWWLDSDNPAHDPFRPDSAEVIGRVLAWTRTIRP